MVRDGAPAYLILLDGLISNAPDDKFLLRQSAVLHSAYAGAFVDDQDRSKLLAGKAKNLAIRASCLSLKGGCELKDMNYRELTDGIEEQPASSIELLYTLASTRIGRIQANSAILTRLPICLKRRQSCREWLISMALMKMGNLICIWVR